MSHNNASFILTHLNSHVSQQSAFNASFFCLISKVKYFPMTSCDPSLKRRFESYVTDGTKTHFCEFEFGSRVLKVTAMPRCSAVNISSFPWTRIWIFRTSPLQIGSLWKSRIRWMTTSNFWFAPLQYLFLKFPRYNHRVFGGQLPVDLCRFGYQKWQINGLNMSLYARMDKYGSIK